MAQAHCHHGSWYRHAPRWNSKVAVEWCGSKNRLCTLEGFDDQNRWGPFSEIATRGDHHAPWNSKDTTHSTSLFIGYEQTHPLLGQPMSKRYGKAHLKKLGLGGLASTTWGMILWPERCVGATLHTSLWNKSAIRQTPCYAATNWLTRGTYLNFESIH